MRQRGHRREQLRRDRLARDQELDRFDSGRLRRLDEVFPLRNEEALLVTLPPRREPADEPQARVRR
jgi:hypothetical protein